MAEKKEGVLEKEEEVVVAPATATALGLGLELAAAGEPAAQSELGPQQAARPPDAAADTPWLT